MLIGSNKSVKTTFIKTLVGIIKSIDDGISTRGHRKNIFKSDFQKIGVCNGTHKKYNTMTDIIYNGETGSGAKYTKGLADAAAAAKAKLDALKPKQEGPPKDDSGALL